MSATSGRRARDPATTDAEEAFDPASTAAMKPPPDSQALSLRPERRWAQLGATEMAPPPLSNPRGPGPSREAESPGPPSARSSAAYRSPGDGTTDAAAIQAAIDDLIAQDPIVLEDDASALSRPVKQIAIGTIVGAVVVVMMMAVNSWGLPTDGGPANGAAPPASLRAATSPAPTVAVGGLTSLQETFDGLPINGVLPGPWQVMGDGSVAIVALPTSIDRSVRLRSSEDGAATALCRATETGTATGVRVAFDYVLGRAGVGEEVLLTMQTGRDGSIELLIGPTGAPIGVSGQRGDAAGSSPRAGLPSPAAGSAGMVWQRVVVEVDPEAGTVSWVSHDTSGAETATGTAAVGVAREAIGMVCLHSPATSAGWIAIDDLIIEG